MTTSKQIIAIAELDGWLAKPDEGAFSVFKDGEYRGTMSFDHFFKSLPQYDHSHDAIVPVIEKAINTVDLAQHFLSNLDICKSDWTPSPTVNQIKTICATPSQLAEALLRATGKWVEE